MGGAFVYARRTASSDRFTGTEETLTGIYSGGIDVAISPAFAVGAEFSYLNYEMHLGDRFGYTIDPVSVMVTGRWRW